MSMIILIAERVDVKTKTVAIDHHRNQFLTIKGTFIRKPVILMFIYLLRTLEYI